jgi:photosystem II stability/assembly factor-like uncharacterized protein
MNDSEFELHLRDELPRRVVPPDAPQNLYAYVAALGLDEPVATVERRFVADRRRTSRPQRGGLVGGARALLSLAAAIAIIAILVAGLAWSSSHQPAPAAPASPSGTPVVSATPTAAAISVPTAEVLGAGRVDANNGWVMTEDRGRLYLTDDGGKTWHDRTPADLDRLYVPQTSNPPMPRGAMLLSFSDAKRGSFIYEQQLGSNSTAPLLYRTDDGGQTWSKSPVPASGSAFPMWIAMPDDRNFLVGFREPVGGNFQVWATADAGSSWTQRGSYYTDKESVRFDTPSDGWAFSMDQGLGMQVVHTVDGGRTWTVGALPYKWPNPGGWSPLAWDGPVASGDLLTVWGDVESGGSSGLNNVAMVAWTSTDQGAHWVVAKVANLGDLLTPGGQHVPGLIPFNPRNSATIKVFDTATGTITGGLDATSICPSVRTGDGSTQIEEVSAASSKDVWVTCSHWDAKAGSTHRYLFGTTDGGRTWRQLTGKP